MTCKIPTPLDMRNHQLSKLAIDALRKRLATSDTDSNSPSVECDASSNVILNSLKKKLSISETNRSGRSSSSNRLEYVGEGYSVTSQHCEEPNCDVFLGINYPSYYCPKHEAAWDRKFDDLKSSVVV